MPSGEHLEWIEINDFRGGLWENDRFMMPANAAQRMEDCYAPPGAGLEPFLRQRLDGDGLSGIFRQPLGYRWDSTQDIEYIVARNEALDDQVIYARSPATPGGFFSTVENMGFGALDPTTSLLTGKVSFDQYIKGTGITGATTDRVTVWSILTHTGTEGIWTTHGTGAADNTQISTVRNSYVCIHQDRIVMAAGPNLSTTEPTVLRWTDPGGTTFPAGNFLRLTSGDRKGVAFMKAYSPSDLLIGMSDGAFYLVQGDLADPVLRRMEETFQLCNSDKNNGTVGIAVVPGGVAFQADRRGIYVTGNGSEAVHLSPQIKRTFDGQGDSTSILNYNSDLIYSRGFLFVPSPVTTDRCLVYDWEGKYWFTTTSLHSGQIGGRRKSQIVVLRDIVGNTWNMNYLDLDDLADPDGDRVTSYIWRSAPFRSPTGRQLEVREVQIIAKSRPTGTAQFNVTVTNEHDETQELTANLAADTESVIALPCRLRGRYVDVTIQAHNLDGAGSEGAPSIEAVRIGVLPGHRIYTTEVTP